MHRSAEKKRSIGCTSKGGETSDFSETEKEAWTSGGEWK